MTIQPPQTHRRVGINTHAVEKYIERVQQELSFGQAPCQDSLPDTARTGQPDNGCLFPGSHEPFFPERTFNHAALVYV